MKETNSAPQGTRRVNRGTIVRIIGVPQGYECVDTNGAVVSADEAGSYVVRLRHPAYWRDRYGRRVPEREIMVRVADIQILWPPAEPDC
jgi:hypothetical protein